MRTMVTRGDTGNIKLFDRMVMELCPYMTAIEIDRTVGFMDRIQGSKYDINPTEADSITQLKIILGSDRYVELKHLWSRDNQPLLQEHGTLKYIHLATGMAYDGLDSTDDESHYTKLYL